MVTERPFRPFKDVAKNEACIEYCEWRLLFDIFILQLPPHSMSITIIMGFNKGADLIQSLSNVARLENLVVL